MYLPLTGRCPSLPEQLHPCPSGAEGRCLAISNACGAVSSPTQACPARPGPPGRRGWIPRCPAGVYVCVGRLTLALRLPKRKRIVRDARGFPQLCALRCTRCLPFLCVPERLPSPLLHSRMPTGGPGLASVREGGEAPALPPCPGPPRPRSTAGGAAGKAQDARDGRDAGLGAAGGGADAGGRALLCTRADPSHSGQFR